MQLAHRNAIITGASEGLGLAIARAFAREGARVLLVARSAEKLSAARGELGDRSDVFPADVSEPEQCRAIVAHARRVLGSIQILVNNAAIQGPIGPIESNDPQHWLDTIRTNLLRPAMLCREVLPGMKSDNCGKIINLSGGGATGPRTHFSAYAASKAAVVRLTETLAEEVKPAKIDINAIAPGAMNTRLLNEVLQAGPQRVGQAEFDRATKQKQQGGVTPESAAELAVFLASSKSDGITGKLISAVWDDWKSLPARRDELARSDVYTLRRIVPENRD